MPRPSKLTPESQDRLATMIRAGATVEVAAAAVGIGERTFYDWLEQNEAFRNLIEQARAESEAGLVARIAKAATNGSWQAAAYLLERRWPERWGKEPVAKPTPAPAEAPGILDELDQIRQRRGHR